MKKPLTARELRIVLDRRKPASWIMTKRMAEELLESKDLEVPAPPPLDEDLFDDVHEEETPQLRKSLIERVFSKDD